jgi:hypothetical protein
VRRDCDTGRLGDYNRRVARRCILAVAAALLCGCGRLGFATVGGDDAPSDSALALGPYGAWSSAVDLSPLNSGGDDLAPTLSRDGLEIVFNSNRGGEYTLYTATRSSRNASFGAPALIPVIDPKNALEYDPQLSLDGLELLYVSTEVPAGVRRLTRATPSSPWGPPTVVSELANREGPSLIDDSRLIVALASIGGIEEWARPKRPDPWSLVRTHSALVGMSFAGVRSDGLEIFVTKVDSGKMYRATRATIDDQFGTPTRVSFDSALDTMEQYDADLDTTGHTMVLAYGTGQSHNLAIVNR